MAVSGGETNQRQKVRGSATDLISVSGREGTCKNVYIPYICVQNYTGCILAVPYPRIISILFQKPLPGLLLHTKRQHLGGVDVIEQHFCITAKIEEHC